MIAEPSLDRAAALRDEVRERKRRIERERQIIRERVIELRAVCAVLGIDFREFRSEGTAHRPDDDRPN